MPYRLLVSLLLIAVIGLGGVIVAQIWWAEPGGREALAPPAPAPPGVDPNPLIVLDDPEMLEAEEASFLRADHQVLGVVVGGEARAYPLPLMMMHEIINDVVGGEPVTITA